MRKINLQEGKKSLNVSGQLFFSTKKHILLHIGMMCCIGESKKESTERKEKKKERKTTRERVKEREGITRARGRKDDKYCNILLLCNCLSVALLPLLLISTSSSVILLITQSELLLLSRCCSLSRCFSRFSSTVKRRK